MNFKKLTVTLLTTLSFCTGSFITSCGKTTPTPKTYAEDEFILAGFWAPYEITEEGFEKYKNCGLNTVQFTNHSRDASAAEVWDATDPVLSKTRYYLGSELTKQSLEMCRKTGLKAILDDNGAHFNTGDTPYSTRESYEEYRDIIVGMHVADEPSAIKMPEYCTPSRVADFKQTYGDLPFLVNLLPNPAPIESYGNVSYEEYLKTYADTVLKSFPENPVVSVDYYPFHWTQDRYNNDRINCTQAENTWLECYRQVSSLAVEHDASLHFYIQSAESNEFVKTLHEEDMRHQLYVGLCFGGTRFTYYCYSIPGLYKENATSVENPMYTACLLDANNQPTHLYQYVKEINAEIQAFASAFKAYKFVRCMASYFDDYYSERFSSSLYDLDSYSALDFSDRKFVRNIDAEYNCLIGCFEREEDEAYMVVGYDYWSADETQTVTVTLKNGATHLAVYGGDGFMGEPTVIKAKNGKCKLNIKGGEGKFIVPLKA